MAKHLWGVSKPAAEAVTGLTFPANGTDGSDIRLQLSGANLVTRYPYTYIWKSNYTQQAGYYANTWQCNDGAFEGGNTYTAGMHPFPCNGAFNGSNEATGGTGDSGTVHYYEIAASQGLAVDYIGNVLGASMLVTKGVWVTQARQSFIQSGGPNDGMICNRYWPNISNPTAYIETFGSLDDYTVPSSPVFIICGCSPWRANTPSSGQNDETPCGSHRFFKMFDAALTISDIATEAAYEGNSAVTAAGIASVWYMNINPTPTDVTDKSGEGHNPGWATANRPTLYTA